MVFDVGEIILDLVKKPLNSAMWSTNTFILLFFHNDSIKFHDYDTVLKGVCEISVY